MRSFLRPTAGGPPRAASRPVAGAVSPAALRSAHEADATMSPDGWEADYSKPGFLAEAPAAGPFSSLPGAPPTA
ncbi:hypothetical protein ACFQ48_21325 [Hymenobacter caeli]|uniref:Uncharacterized protein n=1 Tax=Hymenobacter caeli TaxID=2735894 RepID=A0ABX2FRF3_9BACT|nr:hypothetical protein [Hymenobacter caeli]NRT19571.1 hypothetical protein [Hymenobacter caeli]